MSWEKKIKQCPKLSRPDTGRGKKEILVIWHSSLCPLWQFVQPVFIQRQIPVFTATNQ